MPTLIHAYSTLRQLPAASFDCLSAEYQDHTDPLLKQELHRLQQELTEEDPQAMTATRYAILRHLQRTEHHACFSVDSAEDAALTEWAWESNAILRYPDNSYRDPAGKRLLDSATGSPDPTAQLPFPADARQRKSQTELLLRNRLIDVPAELPPIVSEREVQFRDPTQVARRALAIFIVAVRAESLATGQPISVENLRSKAPEAFVALSPQESAFLEESTPSQQSVINAAWRYESLFALQWALGMHAELPFADTICDVPTVAQIMLQIPHGDWIETARLRPTTEILDAIDFNQRLLWAAREANNNSQPAPASIDGGVISERQHAFNWLIRFEEADWDDVDIPS